MSVCRQRSSLNDFVVLIAACVFVLILVGAFVASILPVMNQEHNQTNKTRVRIADTTE